MRSSHAHTLRPPAILLPCASARGPQVPSLRALRTGFLSTHEIQQLARCSHTTRFFLPLTWGLAEVKAALLTKLQAQRKAPELTELDLDIEPGLMHIYGSFEDICLRLRRNGGATLEILHMPVPFAYFHATKLLLLSALTMASTPPHLSHVCASPLCVHDRRALDLSAPSLLPHTSLSPRLCLQVSYSLVELEEAAISTSRWSLVVSMCVFAVISGIMIGLQAIAVRRGMHTSREPPLASCGHEALVLSSDGAAPTRTP